MMKKWMAKLCLVTFALSLLFGSYQYILPDGQRAEAAVQEELRGVWIASVYNIDFPSKQGLSAEQMKQELDGILNNAQAMHLNAVFFQVRPTADALYRSNLYPWSGYLTGTQGQAPAQGFDPLAYLVAEGKNGESGFMPGSTRIKLRAGRQPNPIGIPAPWQKPILLVYIRTWSLRIPAVSCI